MTPTRSSHSNANHKKGSGESTSSAILIDDEVSIPTPAIPKIVTKKASKKPLSSSAKR